MRLLFRKLFEDETEQRATQALVAIADHNKQVTVEALRLDTNWLDDASSGFADHAEGMHMLAAIDPPLRELMARTLADLLDAYTNHTRTHMLLKAALPFCASMLSCYSKVIVDELRLPKHAPAAVQQTVANWLFWLERDHLINFLVDPDRSRLPWHELSPVVAFAIDLAPPAQAGHGKDHGDTGGALRASLSRLVLVARTLSHDLQGRQLLIADRIAEKLAGFTLISHQHTQQTPFGQHAKRDGPPTVLTQSASLAAHSDSQLFYGLDGNIKELEHLEHVILSLQRLPAEFDPSGQLDVAETLAVIRHLHNRWSRQRLTRLAERKLLTGNLDLAYDFANLHHLLLEGLTKATEATLERVEINDVSASGAGLKLRRGGLKKRLNWLKLGALIAIKTEAMSHWRLGLVRRAVSHSQEEIHVGVQFLCTDPRAVSLSRHLSSAGPSAPDVGNCIAAIYLAPGSLNGQQTVLICQGHELEVGKVYTMHLSPMQNPGVKVKHLLEIGADAMLYVGEQV